jgi:uncharacterized protein DUF4340
MRGLKSTLALLVVLVGLGAYIYFVTWKQPAADTGTKQEKVFAGVDSDKIEEIKVNSASGETTALKKDNGAWQLAQPTAGKADDSEVSGITSALSSLEITRVVDENPTNLNDYGLSNPRIQLEFKASGDKGPRKLMIGEKSPTGGDLFAKRNDEKRVFLIPAFQENTFNKTTFDLRDKTLLKFDRDKVDGIELTAANKTTALSKAGSDWKITKPLDAKADFSAVEGLIGRLQSAQMKSIVTADASPKDLKEYGLEKPDTTVKLNAGSATTTLLLGGKAADNTIYARDASKNSVVTIDTSLADELKKGADDYRRKDLFEFRSYNANRVEITRNGQTIAFERVKGEGANAQDKWRRVSPSAADADKDKVEAMLSRLSNMRATSFQDSAAKTGLDKPAMTVVVKFEDNKKEERVMFGKDGDNVYASRPGEPGAAKADANDFTEVNKSLDELAK